MDIYKFIKKECLKHKGTHYDYKAEWEANRYLVLDKMFVMVGSNKEGRPIVTLKLAPEKGDYLRQTYKGVVIPGYYMNKTHWNSIFLDNPFDENLLSDFIKESYTLILQGFSKKKQEEILNLN